MSVIARFRVDYPDFRLHADLELPGAGVTVLFGPSGSGKSTLLRCIAGLHQAEPGFLQVNGQVWQDSGRKLFVPTHRRALGYVFQEANLFPHLNVAENLQFGLKRLPKSASRRHPDEICGLLGLENLLPRMPRHLSGGERQRVAIARALALNPEILLLDEPLAALDQARKREILPYLQQLHRGLKIPLLYVTHSGHELAQLADYLVVLAQGGVHIHGELQTVLNQHPLPLTESGEIGCIWPANVIRHSPEHSISEVAFSGGVLELPLPQAAPGTKIRLQLLARDVSLSLQALDKTSILNCLPATVTSLTEQNDGHALARLRIGEPGSGMSLLIAQISRKSARTLELKAGMRVFALIKATAIACQA